MGIYIYKENYQGGNGFVFVSEPSKPAKNRTFNFINGQTPYNPNFALLETFAEIQAVENKSSKDYKTWRDALKTFITDLGGGSTEAGFDLLTEGQKVIAATNNIGTGVQILSAIPSFNVRFENSQRYIAKMRGYDVASVRKNRSMKAEAAFWAAAKHVQPVPNISLPEVVLSDLEAAMKVNANELTISLLELYETKGLMGIVSGDGVTGVLDYFTETTNSRFQNGNGFKGKYQGAPIDFNGGSIDDFCDFITSIFVDGDIDQVS